MMKRRPVVKAVRPVFPPSATPALDSTKLVTVEVPRHAPTVVPIASARNTLPALGRVPSSLRSLALSATPTTVPTVSKRSTNRKLKTIATNCIKCSPTQLKLNLKAVSERPERSIPFAKLGRRL